MPGVARARRRAALLVRLCTDLTRSTYAGRLSIEGIDRPLPDLVRRDEDAVPAAVIDHYLDHRFDLLGSGWVQVRHGTACRGVGGSRYPVAPSRTVRPLHERINRANRQESIRVRALVDEEYEPIDWHLDFKSGWRWDEKTWYRRVRTAPAGGADIKAPWELSRMQHLPQLALAYADPASRWHHHPRILSEVQNQILDFIASNPPRYGVNWKCTMDVGIRAANWVLAHSLLREEGAAFHADASAFFWRSVEEHGRHIAGNLESVGARRANHYLGNIAGLIFCAMSLPPSRETDAWLIFGIQELIAEVEYQFLPDGGHFEGSTAYHRFGLEMVLYPAAAILALDPERIRSLGRTRDVHVAGRSARSIALGPEDGVRSLFPSWWWERLERASAFLRAVSGPDRRLTQVGDNDSGRLFKLSPKYAPLQVAEAREKYAHLEGYTDLSDEDTYWMEDHLAVDSTLATARMLLGMSTDAEPDSGTRSKAGRPMSGKDAGAPLPPVDWIRDDAPTTRVFEVSPSGLTPTLTLARFPDFGVYVFRSPRVYLLIRAWCRHPDYTAHLHNDQLGMELWLDGKPLIRDPGTFLYTALATERNRYRSVRAHDTPWPAGSGEPAALDRDLFRVSDPVPCTTVQTGPNWFYGEYAACGIRTARRVRILEDRVVIEDWPGQVRVDDVSVPFSPGYGLQEGRGS